MTKKRYTPNPAVIIFAPVVTAYTVAKHTLKRLHSASEWMDANEAEIDSAMVSTLDATLGVVSSAAKATLVASSFAEGFVEAICEHNEVQINASRKDQVAGWKKTCKSWLKEEDKKENKKEISLPSLEKGVSGNIKVDFTNL